MPVRRMDLARTGTQQNKAGIKPHTSHSECKHCWDSKKGHCCLMVDETIDTVLQSSTVVFSWHCSLQGNNHIRSSFCTQQRTKQFQLRGTYNGHLVPLTDQFMFDQKLKPVKGIVQMTLKHWQAQDFDHISRNYVQYLTTVTLKKCSLKISKPRGWLLKRQQNSSLTTG